MGQANIKRLIEAIPSGKEIELAADLDIAGSLKLSNTAVTATAAELNILDGVTATAAEINQYCDESARGETVTATNVITAAESGKTFFLSSGTEFASTLPAPAAGLRYKFVVAAAPSGANYTVKTNGDANIIHGQISTAETSGVDVVTAAAADIINFVSNLSIIGDYCEVESDGTSWFLSGMCKVQDGMTTVQTA